MRCTNNAYLARHIHCGFEKIIPALLYIIPFLMTRFLLIRHATNDTVGKILAGRMAGVSLNEEGKGQARKLTDRLGHLPIAAIYSSPMERALETAAPLAAALQLEPIIEADFLELNMGDWTGRAYAEIKKEPAFTYFNTFRSCTRIPGGELMMEAQTRFVAGMQKLYAAHPQQTVAIVSHADPIKAAVAYFAGIPLDLFQRIEISPASVSIIDRYDETARILVVNDTGGLHV
jgi:probable phosphoglycerate mutase